MFENYEVIEADEGRITAEEYRNEELRSDVASSNEPKGHLTEAPSSYDEIFGDNTEKVDGWTQLQDLEDDLEELPTEEEADLGELCRPKKGQFEGCDLVDDQTADLLGSIKGGDE